MHLKFKINFLNAHLSIVVLLLMRKMLFFGFMGLEEEYFY